MKKIILSLSLIACCGAAAIAQCNQTVRFTSTKTDFVNATGAIEQSKNEQTQVTFNDSELSLLVNGNVDEQLTGNVRSVNCGWKKTNREGKTILTALLTNKNGDSKNATVTMEGKDGNISMLLEVENQPARKLQMTTESFEALQ